MLPLNVQISPISAHRLAYSITWPLSARSGYFFMQFLTMLEKNTVIVWAYFQYDVLNMNTILCDVVITPLPQDVCKIV